MYCTHCGKETPDESNFCQYCGWSMSEKQTRQSSSAQTVDPYAGKGIWADKYSSRSRVSAVWQATGKLTLHPGELVYSPRFGNPINGKFGIAAASQQETYPLDRIRECHFEKKVKLQPCVVITTDTGETITFAGNCPAAEVYAIITAIKEAIGEDGSAAGNADSGAAWTDVFSDSRDTFADYAFVMEVTNAVGIAGQGCAAIGNVKKGTITAGRYVTAIGPGKLEKGTWQVKSLAVNKQVREQVTAGDSNAALLLPMCPAELLRNGDMLCVKAES